MSVPRVVDSCGDDFSSLFWPGVLKKEPQKTLHEPSSTSISCIFLGVFLACLRIWCVFQAWTKTLCCLACCGRAGGVFQVYRHGLPTLGWRAWELKTFSCRLVQGRAPRVSRVANRSGKEIDVTQIFNFILGVIFLLCILFLGVQCRLIIYMMIYLVVHIKVDSSLSSSQSLNFKMALLLQWLP